MNQMDSSPDATNRQGVRSSNVVRSFVWYILFMLGSVILIPRIARVVLPYQASLGDWSTNLYCKDYVSVVGWGVTAIGLFVTLRFVLAAISTSTSQDGSMNQGAEALLVLIIGLVMAGIALLARYVMNLDCV